MNVVTNSLSPKLATWTVDQDESLLNGIRLYAQFSIGFNIDWDEIAYHRFANLVNSKECEERYTKIFERSISIPQLAACGGPIFVRQEEGERRVYIAAKIWTEKDDVRLLNHRFCKPERIKEALKGKFDEEEWQHRLSLLQPLCPESKPEDHKWIVEHQYQPKVTSRKRKLRLIQSPTPVKRMRLDNTEMKAIACVSAHFEPSDREEGANSSNLDLSTFPVAQKEVTENSVIRTSSLDDLAEGASRTLRWTRTEWQILLTMVRQDMGWDTIAASLKTRNTEACQSQFRGTWQDIYEKIDWKIHRSNAVVLFADRSTETFNCRVTKGKEYQVFLSSRNVLKTDWTLEQDLILLETYRKKGKDSSTSIVPLIKVFAHKHSYAHINARLSYWSKSIDLDKLKQSEGAIVLTIKDGKHCLGSLPECLKPNN